MGLRLEDRWIWDFWLADEGNEHHIFYLQAPRGDQEPLRHHTATVGHAISTDLTHWEVQPDALHPAMRGAWDDLAIWTGSIIRQNGTWHLFYTGISATESGKVQRIGLATSQDLTTWERFGDYSLIRADPRWYALRNPEARYEEAWRDPWVFADPGGDGFHALITARVPGEPADDRGVIAHAHSPNLIEWEVRPPITEPGEFGHMEVPQVVEIDGNHKLLFSAGRSAVSTRRAQRLGQPIHDGTYVASGKSPLGPFDIEGARLLPFPYLYSGRLHRVRSGDWVLLAFHNRFHEGHFVGELADPMPVTVDASGELTVQA